MLAWLLPSNSKAAPPATPPAALHTPLPPDNEEEDRSNVMIEPQEQQEEETQQRRIHFEDVDIDEDYHPGSSSSSRGRSEESTHQKTPEPVAAAGGHGAGDVFSPAATKEETEAEEDPVPAPAHTTSDSFFTPPAPQQLQQQQQTLPPPPEEEEYVPAPPAHTAADSFLTPPAPQHQQHALPPPPPTTASKPGGSHQLAALVAELSGVVKAYPGFSELPDALLASHCLSLVKLLREADSLQRYIHTESSMEGDCAAYMAVCAENDSKSTAKKLVSLRRLREDFDEKNSVLKKELRGLREQITTMRGRTQQTSWSSEKKAIILAALERYQALPEGDLKTLELTESATQELHKWRLQLPKLPEEADTLLDLIQKMRRVTKMLGRLGMPSMSEEALTQAWHAILELLTYRPFADVVEETSKALRDLKDVKLNEAKRR